jgi:beta-lactamase regulating signal transducer with metallopeptidase domain
LAWLADSRWLGLLAEYAVKTTAALLLAVVLAGLLRRRSAALRHFILSVFLVGLLLVPLIPSFHRGWETRLIPARSAADGRDPTPETKVRRVVPAESGPDRGESLSFLVAVDEGAAGAPPAPIRASSPSPVSARGLRNLLPKIWAAGLALLLLRLLVGLAGAVRLSREARPLDDSAWQRLVFRFLSTVALKRRVRLKSHQRIAVPLTWGVIRPVILMPDDSRDWDEDRRSSALFHEMSHVKRVDFAVMLLVRLSLAAFWFNPLSWIVFGMLKREQEKACDELVLRAGIKPSAYAASLLAFRRAPGLPWNPAPALLGMFRGNGMNDRLAAILRQKLTFKEIKLRTRIVLTVVIVFVLALIGSARPAASAPDRDGKAAKAVQASAVAAVAPEESAQAQSVREAAAVAPGPEAREKAEAQERQKEKEDPTKKESRARKEAREAKEAQKAKTIVVTTRAGKSGELEITISEGDKTRTVVMDHPVVIESGASGKAVTLKLNGREIVLKKGDRVSIIANDGTPRTLKEGEVWTVAGTPPVAFSIKEKDGKKVLVYEVAPRVAVIKEMGIVPPGPPAPPAVAAPPAVPAPPAVSAPPAPPQKIKIVESEGAEKTYKIVTVPRAARIVGIGKPNAEIQEKLREIQEKLSRIMEQKPAVRDELESVQESLEELGERLERTSKALDKLEVLGAEAPIAYTIVEPKAAVGSRSELTIAGVHKGDVAGIITGAQGESKVFFKTTQGLKDTALYEKAVARIKKELPEGYTLDSRLDEESGTVTIKIKPPKGRRASDELLKRLLNALREEFVPEAPAKR